MPLYRRVPVSVRSNHPNALLTALASTSLPFSVLLRIITRPGIAAAALFSVMSMRVFRMRIAADASVKSSNSVTLPSSLHTEAFVFGVNWSRLTAASLLVTIPVFILLMKVWARRYLITGLTGGSGGAEQCGSAVPALGAFPGHGLVTGYHEKRGWRWLTFGSIMCTSATGITHR